MYWTDELLKIHAANPQRVAQLQEDLKSHRAEAEQRRKNMDKYLNKDNENYIDDPTMLNLCTDLMQTLPIPKLSNQSSYFKTEVMCWFYL